MPNIPNTKEHPILFSSSSITAILEGCKTQTRRIIRTHAVRSSCPYGQAGDLLWVIEGIRRHFPLGATYTSDLTPVMGKGPTGVSLYGRAQVTWHWKRNYLAARFMPRWASRIMLEIVRVRVERLQDISEVDAKAEGVTAASSARESYQTLWDQINKKRGWAWECNPWVWVIEFKKLAESCE